MTVPSPCEPNVEPADAKAGDIGDLGMIEASSRWWIPKGLWAIETCNENSWDSLKRAMLLRSSADIVIGQETKILSDGTINTAQRQARRLGWSRSSRARTELRRSKGLVGVPR